MARVSKYKQVNSNELNIKQNFEKKTLTRQDIDNANRLARMAKIYFKLDKKYKNSGSLSKFDKKIYKKTHDSFQILQEILFKPLLKKVSRSIHFTDYSRDDFEGQANIIFIDLIQRYDYRRNVDFAGYLSTYLNFNVKSFLRAQYSSFTESTVSTFSQITNQIAKDNNAENILDSILEHNDDLDIAIVDLKMAIRNIKKKAPKMKNDVLKRHARKYLHDNL
jgi:DNA-directed RNA polymerase specialized sigma subunit